MHPILFTIGDREIHFYGVFFGLSILLGVILSTRRGAREGFDELRLYRMFILVILGALLGSRLVHVVTHVDLYLNKPARLFSPRTGLVFYGGYLGAIAAGGLYLRKHRHPVLPILDIAATYMGLGLALHRSMACFMAGCCHGCPTEMPWGVVFPSGSYADRLYGQVAVHPTQLYEAILGLIIFAALVAWRRKRVVYGEQFTLQLYLYAIGRFVIEFFRGDVKRGFYGPLSTSQWVSVALLLCAGLLTWLVVRRRRLLRAGRLDPKGISEPHDYVPLPQ